MLAQQPVVNENAVQLLADGPVQQGGSHSGINTAAQSEDDLVSANLIAQLGHGLVSKAGRGPIPCAPADIDDEVFEQLRAVGAVPHLRVELNPPHGTIHVAEARKLDVVGAANGFELIADAQDGVAVAHPHLGFLGYPIQ